MDRLTEELQRLVESRDHELFKANKELKDWILTQAGSARLTWSVPELTALVSDFRFLVSSIEDCRARASEMRIALHAAYALGVTMNKDQRNGNA